MKDEGESFSKAMLVLQFMIGHGDNSWNPPGSHENHHEHNFFRDLHQRRVLMGCNGRSQPYVHKNALKGRNGDAGVKVERSSVKDQLVISGNDVELVSRSAALINQVPPFPPPPSHHPLYDLHRLITVIPLTYSAELVCHFVIPVCWLVSCVHEALQPVGEEGELQWLFSFHVWQ